MNKTETFEQYFIARAARIERELKKALPADWDIPDRLRESMMYSLLAGGKRLRPLLVIAAAESLGGDAEAAVPAACAIEMVHTYSLIHDDLPAMDNDDFRRGKPTNHKIYGEAMAVLAGDAWLTHAFYTIVQTFRAYSIPSDQALAVVEDLALYAGAKGMVGGQAADVIGEQGITGLAQLEYIHLRKTSDLIVFSLRAGARIAGAADEQLEALTRFGSLIGLAFQIQDDLLDVIGDERKLGKKVNSDEKLAKVTYPYFLGVEASRVKVRELTEQAQAVVTGGVIPDPARLLQIAEFLMRRDH